MSLTLSGEEGSPAAGGEEAGMGVSDKGTGLANGALVSGFRLGSPAPGL